MRILGIETSCDETGIAVYDDKLGLLANQLYSQSIVHADYGGVIPEIASRNHAQKIVPLIQKAIKEANLVEKSKIDAIAYTAGPGLIGALLVGASIGCTLGFSWKIPVIAVHHVEGHLMMPMLEKKISFPFLGLLVSGGHTQLINVKDIGKYILLGETLDDAVGEAFDKTAKLLGLRYPGGALLSKMAHSGRRWRFQFPRPMIDRPGLDFSFSGLKTFAANIIQKYGKDLQTCADVAYSFEEAVVDTLLIKSKRALNQTGLERLVISGGVSANDTLRTRMSKMVKLEGKKLFYSCHEFCTDNGAMIAYAGMKLLKNGIYRRTGLGINVYPRWSLKELSFF